MTKWKYLKGSEKDFEFAPDWCSQVIRVKNSNGLVIGYEENVLGNQRVGDRLWWPADTIVDDECYKLKVEDVNSTSGVEIIAQREPITDEDDLNECICSTEQLITERGSRYGKFKDGAEIMQELKDVMRKVDGWHNLTPSQREALDMIQHKIGRILNGDPTYDDSWKDIAGYATLIVNELNGEIK